MYCFPTGALYSSVMIENSCDIPTWYLGDEWIYTADPVSFIGDDFSFIGAINNFKRQVVDITTLVHGDESYVVYELGISGDISGVITWDVYSANLNGVIQGVSYIRMSDLAEIKTEIISTGTIQIPLINPSYTLANLNLLFPPVELYDFPLHVSEQWQVSSTIITSGSFEIEGFIQEDYSSTEQFNVIISCLEKETVSVPAGDFECFPVTYGSNTFWYSPEVGNIVKSVVDQGQKSNGFEMDLYLESYSHAIQPIHLTQQIVPSKAFIGQDVHISGYATDEYNNVISGGDITICLPRTADSWDTTTNNDGFYEITITAPFFEDDTVTEGEFGSDGIIVTCVYNNLEGYRVKTLVIFDNMPPLPPQITGQTNGTAGKHYQYTFTTTDPEGDDIYYLVDWGDTTTSEWMGPFNSGENMVLPHSWGEQGTFLIRAKAKDNLGAVSEWAELTVTMPKQNLALRINKFLGVRSVSLFHII